MGQEMYIIVKQEGQEFNCVLGTTYLHVNCFTVDDRFVLQEYL